MIAVTYSELKTGLKRYFDRVEDDDEVFLIKRRLGKGAVMMSIDEYNSIMETLHLLCSRKNADRLYESIDQMKSSKG